jgi:hypothetical protein
MFRYMLKIIQETVHSTQHILSFCTARCPHKSPNYTVLMKDAITHHGLPGSLPPQLLGG